MRTIRANAKQVLIENYKQFLIEFKKQYPAPDEVPFNLGEWAELESESDYNFFRWLFNDETIGDFGSDLPDDDWLIAKEFFDSLNGRFYKKVLFIGNEQVNKVNNKI